VLVISGIIDGGVRLDGGSTSGTIKSQGSGLLSASRLNFSGIEDLGSGLQAGFVLESGLAIDTGTGVSNPPGTANGPLSFGRTAAVAIGSDRAGFVSMGRQYTPLWAVSAGPANDPFGANWLGGIGTIYNTTVRASNSIVYSYGYTARTMLLPAPRSGLGAAVMWGLSESGAPASSHSGEQLGFNLSYGNGTWWAGYGYHQVKGSNVFINPTAPVTDQPTLRQQTLGASYQIGPARLYAGYNTGRNGLSGAGATDRRNFDLGAAVSLGGLHTIRVLYGKANERAVANASFSTYQVGYQYDFSKRTAFYAAAGQVANGDNTAVALVGAVGTYAKGATARSAITGIRHNF
jgi:predicted porin